MEKHITLRLSLELHQQLKAAAAEAHRSLHAEILWRVEQSLKADKKEPK